MRQKRNVFREWITGIDESYLFPPDDKEPVFKTTAKVHKDPPDGILFFWHNYVDDNYPTEKIDDYAMPGDNKKGDRLTNLLFVLICLAIVLGLCFFWWLL